MSIPTTMSEVDSTVIFSPRESTTHPRPKHPQYKFWKNRMVSFETLWPVIHPIKPQTMVKYGFFYTGTSDFIVCFHCGGGLKNLQSDDDIFKLHASLYTQCPFLLRIFSHDDLQQVAKSISHTSLNMKGFMPYKCHFTSRRIKSLTKQLKETKAKYETDLKAWSYLKYLKNELLDRLMEKVKKLNAQVVEHEKVLICKQCNISSITIAYQCGHMICDHCFLSNSMCAICGQANEPHVTLLA